MDFYFIFGFSELTNESNVKHFTNTEKKKLIEINDALAGINMLLGESIPRDKTLYFYSKERAQNLNGFAEGKEQENWPMLPKYLEGLVDTNMKPEKKLKVK